MADNDDNLFGDRGKKTAMDLGKHIYFCRSLPSTDEDSRMSDLPPIRGRDGQRFSNGNAGTMTTK